MTSSVASAAAQGTGPPPNVLPRSPTPIDAVIAGVATTAPIGSPEASPFARVSTSGTTPTASAVAERSAPAHSALHLVEDQGGAARVAGPARRAQEVGAQSRAPESPCTGSRITAATVSSTAASSAGMSSAGTRVESGMPLLAAAAS